MIIVKDRVRFVETDLMGVVHHSNYLRWFEMGRVEYLRQAGILLNGLIAQGIIFPIIDVQCTYRSSAKFDDIILVETTLKEVSRAKMVFSYNVVKEEGHVLLAQGETKNVFTNLESKIVRLPDSYYAKLAASVAKA